MKVVGNFSQYQTTSRYIGTTNVFGN